MNWGSILAQAQTAMDTPKRKNEVRNKIDSYLLGGAKLVSAQTRRPVIEVADEFIKILKDTVVQHHGSDFASGDLGDTAVTVASDLSSGSPYKVGNNFKIDIQFNGDTHRVSLYPAGYDGIDDVIKLLNNGIGGAKNYVYGDWHGERIRSLRSRAGSYFIQEAKSKFMSECADKYGVIDIDISKYE